MSREENLQTQNRGFSKQPPSAIEVYNGSGPFTIHGGPVSLYDALEDVLKERSRQLGDPQDGKVKIDWRALDRLNSRNDWSAYITRYTGRATDERAPAGWSPHDFRLNMVKVAATALAAIQAYDEGAACSHAPA